MVIGNCAQLYCQTQVCIKNKDTCLVWNKSDWSMDEPVVDNRPLGLLINLRYTFYHLDRLKNSKTLYGRGELYTAVISCTIVY